MAVHRPPAHRKATRAGLYNAHGPRSDLGPAGPQHRAASALRPPDGGARRDDARRAGDAADPPRLLAGAAVAPHEYPGADGDTPAGGAATVADRFAVRTGHPRDGAPRAG